MAVDGDKVVAKAQRACHQAGDIAPGDTVKTRSLVFRRCGQDRDRKDGGHWPRSDPGYSCKKDKFFEGHLAYITVLPWSTSFFS